MEVDHYESTLRGLLLRRQAIQQEAMSQANRVSALDTQESILRAFLLTREEARQLREESLWSWMEEDEEEETTESQSQEDVLRRQALQNFARVGLSKVNVSSISEEDVCAICLCEVDCDAVATGCEHKFHEECISECLLRHTTCPMCRADMSHYGVKQVTR